MSTQKVMKDYYYTVDLHFSGTNPRKSCKGCVYRRGLSRSSPKFTVCNYCFDTGKPRGCSPEHCDKKKLRGATAK